METGKSYDTMPYPSKFFLQTHPDQLAAIANIHGLTPKAPQKCRVLELGCGNGSNLISHAYNLKDSVFVGVDISAKHIDNAKASAKELKLTNMEFYEADLMEMTTEDFGKFDYIIAHGLISWIPDFVIDRVFSIYSEMLEPQGVGYISYNVYPGCHYRDMVSNIMRFHTRNTEEPLEKVQNAISFLSFLTENVTDKEIYQPILRHELERHFKHEASDIFHDDLSDCYAPMYFNEFAKKLDTNELQFLSEAELHASSMGDFSPEVLEVIDQSKNIVEREQYMDFFRGRIFRQTLVCRKDIEINRQPKPLDIEKFLLAAPVKPQSDNIKLTERKAVRFVGDKGFGLEIDHPLTKACLVHLGEIWGRAIPLKELLQVARQNLESQGYKTESWDNEFNITRDIFLKILMGTDLLHLHVFASDANQIASETPELNNLARWQIGHANNVTTLFGLNIGVDDVVSKHLLYLLNGKRNRKEITDKMRDFIKTNEDVENKNRLLESLDEWLESNLLQLGKLGLFTS